MTESDVAAVRSGLRSLAASVGVVAARDPHGIERGLTVTSFMSVTLEPPILAVCLSRGTALPWVVRAGRAFSLNVLTADQVDVAQAFAGGHEPADAFEVGRWRAGTKAPVPVLADALVSFECVVHSIDEHSTHDLVLGRIVSVDEPSSPEAATTLVRHAQRYARMGPDVEPHAETS